MQDSPKVVLLLAASQYVYIIKKPTSSPSMWEIKGKKEEGRESKY